MQMTSLKKLEALALEFQETGQFYKARERFRAAAIWFKDAGQQDKSVEMTVAQAETFYHEAQARVSSDDPSYLVASSFYEEAIQVYRNIPRKHRDTHQVDQRIAELRDLLTESGQLSLEEMTTVSSPGIDITSYAEQARDLVSNKPVHKALLRFANLHRISVDDLRKSAIDSIANYPLPSLFNATLLSDDGRVIGRRPGSLPPQENDEAVRARMIQFHYNPLIEVIVRGMILPALDTLNLEHRIRQSDFIQLARQSPIVPIGREVLVGKALFRGYEGDFDTALHLLSPQLENIVRFHLKMAGVKTSTLNEDGIETENGLSTLIDIPKTSTIFGQDLTFELKALFCDNFGVNLRNNVAHGLLDDNQCNSIESVYSWWLGLKLIFNTYWNAQDIEGKNSSQGQNVESDTSGDEAI